MSHDEVVDPNLITGALDQGVREFEPMLAQLDEWSKNTIMHMIYVMDDILNEETGNKERVIVGIKYPDLHNAAGYALSHLNIIMNYSRPQAKAVLLGWRGGYLGPLSVKYRRDDIALTILNALDSVITRNILGGSSGGTHQTYIEALVGSIKTIKVGERTQ